MTSPSSVDPLFLSFQLALAGRYSIDREIGRGGMGIVYLAREVHLDRPVAIKLLPPSRARQPALRERFLNEARLAAKLSHPNIIPIHAVEEAAAPPPDVGTRFVFYVMAFVDGETLAQRVRTRGPLSSAEGARVLREVAWALAYAHGQGLVHRDVKPDNILIESASGRVLVADFGIAAALELPGFGARDPGSGATAPANPESRIPGPGSSIIAGTPEVMSPEQALGRPIDARSDLYALGATAFFAFSGRFPFEGKSATEILARQVTEPAPPLASLGMAVPRRLASLVDHCLAKDPAQRPASAESLAEQLGAAIAQRRELPVALRAFVKRTGRMDGGGTLLSGMGLLTASIVVSAWSGGRMGFATLLLGATVAPFAYLTGAARRLMMLGFTHQDLEPAFRSEMERAQEELAVEHRLGPAALERWLPRLAKTSGVLFGALIVARILATPRGPMPGDYTLQAALSAGLALAALTTTLSTVSLLALQQRHKDVDTGFWSKVWMGRIGQAAFSVARRLLGTRAVGPAMTHRATELSLGMAAEHLYATLPRESRQALGDLPVILRRLQEDAQSLRKRHDELQEALGDAADPSAPEHADLREARDTIHAKLGEAVGALETIRLNLLRLHAGSTTVEGLTTHLGLAAEVSEEVERLIAAHADVERLLGVPRPTPA